MPARRRSCAKKQEGITMHHRYMHRKGKVRYVNLGAYGMRTSLCA
jgi:hypothetical protein